MLGFTIYMYNSNFVKCMFCFPVEFGDIGSVNIVRDKGSRENKGFAFVRYRKVSSAALAIENCDKSKYEY